MFAIHDHAADTAMASTQRHEHWAWTADTMEAMTRIHSQGLAQVLSTGIDKPQVPKFESRIDTAQTDLRALQVPSIDATLAIETYTRCSKAPGSPWR